MEEGKLSTLQICVFFVSCATVITVAVTVTVKLADKTEEAVLEKCSCSIIFMCVGKYECTYFPQLSLCKVIKQDTKR